MTIEEYEPDEDEFLYDGRQITVLRGQHPGNFYGAHVFFLAQRYAFEPGTSILRDEQGFPMVGFLHTPRGREHRHEPLIAQIAWVVSRIFRGLLTRALRVSQEPLRIALTGFGPFEDQRGHSIPHNVSGEFTTSPQHLRSALESALPDLLAPRAPNLVLPDSQGPDDVTVGCKVYDPNHPDGRPVLLLSRTLPVDTHALSEELQSGLLGLLRSFAPHVHLGIGVRRRGSPEFVIEEVSDNSGMAMHPEPHHAPEVQPSTGHPLNRAAARAFARGVRELGGYPSA